MQELLNVKKRLEALETKEHERDLRIHILTTKNQALAESNKVLKDQVFLLQETLSVGKAEWQRMKDTWKSMKDEGGKAMVG